MDARTKLLLGRITPTRAAVPVPAGRVQVAPESAYASACPVSALHTTCCEPCADLDFCRDDANCCLECHFGYEEKLAFPYLPAEIQDILREQHAWLAANDYPPEEVAAHAEYEMAWFLATRGPDGQGIPQCVIDQVNADHEEHAAGRLLSRDTTQAPAPAMAFSGAPVPAAAWVRPRRR